MYLYKPAKPTLLTYLQSLSFTCDPIFYAKCNLAVAKGFNNRQAVHNECFKWLYSVHEMDIQVDGKVNDNPSSTDDYYIPHINASNMILCNSMTQYHPVVVADRSRTETSSIVINRSIRDALCPGFVSPFYAKGTMEERHMAGVSSLSNMIAVHVENAVKANIIVYEVLLENCASGIIDNSKPLYDQIVELCKYCM